MSGYEGDEGVHNEMAQRKAASVGFGDKINNTTNLIVNYLPSTMTDDSFRKLFSTVGTVTDTKVVRDPGSGICIGYGFVNYESSSDAQTAITKLNGLRLLNKTLKVALARPKSEKTKNCNLYVTGLPSITNDDYINQLFSPYGSIINIKLLMNPMTHQCNGAGFVLLGTTDECDAAIAALHGTQLDGAANPLNLSYAHNNNKKQQLQGNYGPPGMQASAAGPMRVGRTAMGRNNPMGNKSDLGAGTVTDPSLAQRCDLGIVIFIRNLPLDTDDENLYSLFSPFGNVRKVSIMRTEEGKGKGFGFVTMADDQEAVRAVLKLNRSTYKEKQLEVRFKLKKDVQMGGAGGGPGFMQGGPNAMGGMFGGGQPGTWEEGYFKDQHGWQGGDPGFNGQNMMQQGPMGNNMGFMPQPFNQPMQRPMGMSPGPRRPGPIRPMGNQNFSPEGNLPPPNPRRSSMGFMDQRKQGPNVYDYNHELY